MSFPAGPPVSFTDLRAEFGGGVANDLGDYVRGGAFVPDIPQNAGVPTAPPISLGDFYGSTAEAVALSDYAITRTVLSPLVAVAQFTLRAQGGLNFSGDTSAPPLNPNEWINNQGPGAGDPYECRATLVSGPAPSAGPTLGQWFQLNVDRTWTQENTGVGFITTVLDVDISLLGTSTPIATGQITLNAFVEV